MSKKGLDIDDMIRKITSAEIVEDDPEFAELIEDMKYVQLEEARRIANRKDCFQVQKMGKLNEESYGVSYDEYHTFEEVAAGYHKSVEEQVVFFRDYGKFIEEYARTYFKHLTRALSDSASVKYDDEDFVGEARIQCYAKVVLKHNDVINPIHRIKPYLKRVIKSACLDWVSKVEAGKRGGTYKDYSTDLDYSDDEGTSAQGASQTLTDFGSTKSVEEDTVSNNVEKRAEDLENYEIFEQICRQLPYEEAYILRHCDMNGFDWAHSEDANDRAGRGTSAKDKENLMPEYEDALTTTEIAHDLNVSKVRLKKLIRQTIADYLEVRKELNIPDDFLFNR